MRHDLILPFDMSPQIGIDNVDALHTLEAGANNRNPENIAHMLDLRNDIKGENVGHEEIPEGAHLEHDDAENTAAGQTMQDTQRDTSEQKDKGIKESPSIQRSLSCGKSNADDDQQQREQKEANRPLRQSLKLNRPRENIEMIGDDGCADQWLLLDDDSARDHEIEAPDRSPRRDGQRAQRYQRRQHLGI